MPDSPDNKTTIKSVQEHLDTVAVALLEMSGDSSLDPSFRRRLRRHAKQIIRRSRDLPSLVEQKGAIVAFERVKTLLESLLELVMKYVKWM